MAWASCEIDLAFDPSSFSPNALLLSGGRDGKPDCSS